MEKCESAAGLGPVREGAEEDVERTGDGQEVEGGLEAAKEERKGVTAEGDKEGDLEMGDLGAEEEELEDVTLLTLSE